MVAKKYNVTERYTYRVEWSEADREFVGLCSEFPSLSHLDSSQAKALNGIVKLVSSVVEDMCKDGEDPPEPFSLREYSGKFLTRISPELHRRLSIKAAEEGTSFNRLVSRKLAE